MTVKDKVNNNAHSPFDMGSVQFVRTGPVADIPFGTHSVPGQARRWEELGQQIQAASRNGAYVLFKVTGDKKLVERVRQGLEAEQKRFNLKSHCRAVPLPNGSWELFFTAVDPSTGKLVGQ